MGRSGGMEKLKMRREAGLSLFSPNGEEDVHTEGTETMRHVLLISNSTQRGSGYLEPCIEVTASP